MRADSFNRRSVAWWAVAIAVFGWLLPSQAIGNNSVELREETALYPLGQHVEYLEDAEGKLSVEAALEAKKEGREKGDRGGRERGGVRARV